MRASSSVVIRAFAKVNLDLRITATRADGFHDLRTVFQSIDLADTLSCVARPGPFQIACTVPGVPLDRANLVWRAAAGLWTAGGREGEPRDTAVTIHKRIPVGAGLGGGSSDAAAALLALRQLWKVRVAGQELHGIARRVGSDVAYFLVGGTALGLGRGDEVYPLAELPRWWLALAFPDFAISTADAYSWYDKDHAAGPSPSRVSYLPGTWLGGIIPLVNDLETPVARRHPDVNRVRAALDARGALMSGMSGSGPTVFGVFKEARAAGAAAQALKRSGVRAARAHLLDRRQAGRPID